MVTVQAGILNRTSLRGHLQASALSRESAKDLQTVKEHFNKPTGIYFLPALIVHVLCWNAVQEKQQCSSWARVGGFLIHYYTTYIIWVRNEAWRIKHMEAYRTNRSCTVDMAVAYFIISLLAPVPAWWTTHLVKTINANINPANANLKVLPLNTLSCFFFFSTSSINLAVYTSKRGGGRNIGGLVETLCSECQHSRHPTEGGSS